MVIHMKVAKVGRSLFHLKVSGIISTVLRLLCHPLSQSLSSTEEQRSFLETAATLKTRLKEDGIRSLEGSYVPLSDATLILSLLLRTREGFHCEILIRRSNDDMLGTKESLIAIAPLSRSFRRRLA